VSKGLKSIVSLENGDVSDLDTIALFYSLPGFFSIMLPALYLGKGLMMYRLVFCFIMIISVIGKV
jgi:hypothetical protein